MSYIKELEKILKDDVMIELKETISELEETIKKKTNNAVKDELKYMQDVQAFFNAALEEIDNGKMTEETALDVLEGLEEMRLNDED